jgi:hypothetical protein
MGALLTYIPIGEKIRGFINLLSESIYRCKTDRTNWPQPAIFKHVGRITKSDHELRHVRPHVCLSVCLCVGMELGSH